MLQCCNKRFAPRWIRSAGFEHKEKIIPDSFSGHCFPMKTPAAKKSKGQARPDDSNVYQMDTKNERKGIRYPIRILFH